MPRSPKNPPVPSAKAITKDDCEEEAPPKIEETYHESLLQTYNDYFHPEPEKSDSMDKPAKKPTEESTEQNLANATEKDKNFQPYYSHLLRVGTIRKVLPVQRRSLCLGTFRSPFGFMGNWPRIKSAPSEPISIPNQESPKQLRKESERPFSKSL